MKEMNLKIRRVPYSRLTKAELANYTETTISIVDKHEPQLASYNPLFEMLKDKKNDIELLRLNYGIDEQRLRAKEAKEELNLSISTFKLNVKRIGKAKPDIDMHVITDPIKKHLSYLDKCRNDNAYSQRIAGFLDLVERDKEIQSFLDDRNLIEDVQYISAYYGKLVLIWNKRIQQLSERPYCNTKLITSGIVKTANRLFDAIEASYIFETLKEGENEGLEGDETAEKIDLVALIEELNQLTLMARNRIKKRDNINKRKRNGEQIDDIIDNIIDKESDTNDCETDIFDDQNTPLEDEHEEE